MRALFLCLFAATAFAQAPKADDRDGTPGNWEGCRGNGLLVCTELAGEAYFRAHPACTPNDTCAGQFFTCNHRCPPPTAEQKRRDDSGTPGNWEGCRGNGLSVCAELVTERYFRDHPACAPNRTCAGLYFTCNHQCPTPAATEQTPLQAKRPPPPPGRPARSLSADEREVGFKAFDEVLPQLKGLDPAAANARMKQFVREHPTFEDAGVSNGNVWARFRDGRALVGPSLEQLNHPELKLR